MNTSITKVSKGVYAATSSIAIFSDKKQQPTSVVKKNDDGQKIVYWGDDNNYPQKFLEALRKNGAASGALKILKATHFGEGFHLYKENFENGKKNHQVINLSDFPDIKSFFQKTKWDKFLLEIITDLEIWNFALPEFVVSKDYKKINIVKRQRAAWARFVPMDKDALISKAYLKPEWEDDSIEKDTPSLNLVDPYWTVEQIRNYLKKKKIYKFVYPVYYPMIDEVYYPKVDWHSSYHNGWFEVSNSVAKLKKYIFENQLHVKYIIYVNNKYFEKMYGAAWDEFDIDKQDELRRQLIKAINEHLMGNEAGGRSITAPEFLDDNGNYVKGITVEPIDTKMKDGAYLPDASAANSEILFPMGVDPSLLGAGVPGGKLGAGSGSDKREAFTILSALFNSKRVVTNEIWNLTRDFNNWDTDLKGAFPNIVLTTLDKNPTGKQTAL